MSKFTAGQRVRLVDYPYRTVLPIHTLGRVVEGGSKSFTRVVWDNNGLSRLMLHSEIEPADESVKPALFERIRRFWDSLSIRRHFRDN